MKSTLLSFLPRLIILSFLLSGLVACANTAGSDNQETPVIYPWENQSTGFPSEQNSREVFPVTSTPREKIAFQHLGIDQGLSMSTVRDMVQDSLGLIWIGTEDGLNLFDGYNFEVFRPDSDDPNSLSGSIITELSIDDEDVLWIGTYRGGLNRFDPKTNQITRYLPDPAIANSLSSEQISAILVDRNGIVWVGTDNGLNRFAPESGNWQLYYADPQDSGSLSNNSILAAYQDSLGNLWFGTARGLDRFDPVTQQFSHYQHDPEDPSSLSGTGVSAIYEDRLGQLWIGTVNGGLNLFDPETGTFVSYQHDPDNPDSLSDNYVTDIIADAQDILWVGTSFGLQYFDPETGAFHHYFSNGDDPQGLSDDSINSLLVDSAGGLWIGTGFGAINRYDRRSEQFAMVQPYQAEAESVNVNSVWSIYEDSSGVLWVGTNGGGLNAYDPVQQQWHHLRHDLVDPVTLSNDVVMSIQEDAEGTLWVGTWGGGLNHFYPETNRFIRYRANPQDSNSLSSDTVWLVYFDQDGTLWLGTDYGLNSFDWATKSFRRYLNDPEDTRSLSNNLIGAIYEDTSGNLWVGTHGGLNRLDRETGQFTRYVHDPADPESISHDVIFSIHADQSGNLWLGTFGGGLIRFDPAAETFITYRQNDGLSNDTVYGILEDERGHLWLSTNNGISQFDPETELFQNYDIADGLQAREFNYNGYYQNKDGVMYFGGVNGLNAFHPEAITDNPFMPPLVLTSITQGGEPLASDQMTAYLPEITLRWPSNYFDFEFAALNYFQSEQNQYAYKLENFDEAWNYIENRRFGRYTNLPGGNYTLRLIGSNNDGVWNSEGVAIAVSVVPPIWDTWGFRVALLLVLGGILFGGYQWRVRSIEARQRRLESEVADRTKELGMLNSIASVVSSSLDLQEILESALNKTVELMQVDAGGIYIFRKDTARLKIAAASNLDDEFVREIDDLQPGEGYSGRVMLSKQTMNVPELSSDPRLTRSIVGERGFRSAVIAPLMSHGEGVGTIFVISSHPREFSTQETRLLSSIGSQIGVAIENANLYEEERLRAEQFRAISEISRQFTLSLDLDEVLAQVVSVIQQSFGYNHVSIGLIEQDEVVFRVGAGGLWDDPSFKFEPTRLKVGVDGLSGWVAAHGEPLLIPDVRQEERHLRIQPSATLSELVVPITSKGQVIGVLDAQSDHLNGFDETDLAVMQLLAQQAGTVIENARLYKQSQQLAVMDERSRLARELHDAVTQTLFSASLIAEALPTAWRADPQEGAELVWELRQLSRGALAEMRTLLLELRPTALVDTRLEDLLRQLGEAVTGREGIPVSVSVEGDCEMPADVHIAFYRIAQEALNNVVKHAQASKVDIFLRSGCVPVANDPAKTQESVILTVQDNGRGFTAVKQPGDRLGLQIMQERAQGIGATLMVESQPKSGTQITVLWESNPEADVHKEQRGHDE